MLCYVFNLFKIHFDFGSSTFLAVVSQIPNQYSGKEPLSPDLLLRFMPNVVCEHHIIIIIVWVIYSKEIKEVLLPMLVQYSHSASLLLCTECNYPDLNPILLNHNPKYSVNVVLRWIITILVLCNYTQYDKRSDPKNTFLWN